MTQEGLDSHAKKEREEKWEHKGWERLKEWKRKEELVEACY